MNDDTLATTQLRDERHSSVDSNVDSQPKDGTTASARPAHTLFCAVKINPRNYSLEAFVLTDQGSCTVDLESMATLWDAIEAGIKSSNFGLAVSEAQSGGTRKDHAHSKALQAAVTGVISTVTCDSNLLKTEMVSLRKLKKLRDNEETGGVITLNKTLALDTKGDRDRLSRAATVRQSRRNAAE